MNHFMSLVALVGISGHVLFIANALILTRKALFTASMLILYNYRIFPLTAKDSCTVAEKKGEGSLCNQILKSSSSYFIIP